MVISSTVAPALVQGSHFCLQRASQGAAGALNLNGTQGLLHIVGHGVKGIPC